MSASNAEAAEPQQPAPPTVPPNPEPQEPGHEQRKATGSLVLRNTLFLMGAQIVNTPLSILINVMMGRYLGPNEFGLLYLASTFCSFGFLFVDWGQSSVVPAIVARERSSVNGVLGSSLLFRLAAACIVYVFMAPLALIIAPGHGFQLTLVIVAALALVGSLYSAFLDTLRGLERLDLSAYNGVGQQLLTGALVIPILLLGGRLHSVLLAQIAAVVVVLAVAVKILGGLGVRPARPHMSHIKRLLHEGTPFVFFGFAMALQPNVDAGFLSRMVPTEVIGWHAAARRLLGFLVTPAGALIGALYPTLCRLHAEDRESFVNVTRQGVQSALLLATPIALGCALYADIGVAIYSKEAFGPAAMNLRLLAPFILLVYVSMPLGSSLLAAGRQRTWAGVQLVCVGVSLILDPLLVPLMQRRYANGGLGVCIATVASELVMVVCGVWMTPRGIFDRSWLRKLLPLLAGAAGMTATALALAAVSLTPYVAAPLAVAAYGGTIWATGGVDPVYVEKFKAKLRSKLKR
ncbi:MAG TPA: flippase [Polyangiaceae bacterium]|nr:flippase [Polyangiaceae bacterium]